MHIHTIRDAVLTYNQAKTAEAVQKALEDGEDIEVILNEGLISAMETLGKEFSEGTLFVPEMLLGAMTMKAGLEVLKPYLLSSGTKMSGVVVIGTVKGDQHDVGKNLVSLMLEGGGFKVIDLGVDQNKDNFLKAVQTHKADIVALSSLLTTCLPAMEETVNYLKTNINGIKIMVGGAPTSQNYADQIGADGYGKNGTAAVKLAKSLLSTALTA